MKPFYSSKENEYEHLRRGIGLSDWEHVSRVQVKGPDALDVVNRLVLSDAARIPVGRVAATFILNPDGSVFADTYVWNHWESYFLLAEGPGPGELLRFVNTHGAPSERTTVTDIADQVAIFGIDGPFAWELLKELIGVKILGLRYLEVMPQQSIAGVHVDILRAGKTGEFGYLVVCPTASANSVWTALLEKGKDFDATQCGRQALDLCKLENRFINMQHEGAKAANALELNCRIMVQRDKEEYTAAEAIQKALAGDVKRRLIGLVFDDPGNVPIEAGAIVQYQDDEIGEVVAADFSYVLGRDIALAFIHNDYAFVGCPYSVKTRAGLRAAQTVSAPFIFNKSLTLRPQEHSFFTVDWSCSLSEVASTCSV
jgi:glycine cleavage system aminomethyltransferase T